MPKNYEDYYESLHTLTFYPGSPDTFVIGNNNPYRSSDARARIELAAFRRRLKMIGIEELGSAI
jgi:hypothetical protein